MSNATERSTDDTQFTSLITAIVADQAPRVFVVVLEFGELVEAEIVAWGMALDTGAYMITVDGRNQYALAEPENALMYVRGRTNTTPHLVWAASASELS
ncbi:hypothetical protein KIPE111705_19715 [Kibdelosporangium persicum]|uniref:Immunity protein 35 n=1 Tax=Kibdelosporangium persicum TaxID=2698649 RepID=A0ABX2EY26_9PSEU|nr:hypothetical protein [Kibdelosporangium persicum]NRN63617.1 hypothetical protein [Kibdelosporangium persicum]